MKSNVNKILNMSGIPKIANIYPSLAQINENAYLYYCLHARHKSVLQSYYSIFHTDFE